MYIHYFKILIKLGVGSVRIVSLKGILGNVAFRFLMWVGIQITRTGMGMERVDCCEWGKYISRRMIGTFGVVEEKAEKGTAVETEERAHGSRLKEVG